MEKTSSSVDEQTDPGDSPLEATFNVQRCGGIERRGTTGWGRD